jgi:hypothetical protein
MNRQGWLLEEKDNLANDCWLTIQVFMDRKLAEEGVEEYINSLTREPEGIRLRNISVIENDQSIDDFYNQIEQENPKYQAELEDALTEVKREIDSPTPSNNPYVDKDGIVRPENTRKWLRWIMNEADGKNWLNTISICGGD